MGDIKESSYTAVLEKVKEICPQLLLAEFLSDFRLELVSAIKNTFQLTDEKIMCTFYNYAQVYYC